MRKPSKFLLRALAVLKNNPGIRAQDFALEVWPDSNMHRRVSNQGHGACRGKAAWLKGGSYLQQLRQKGLATDSLRYSGEWPTFRQYFITKAGETLLAKHSTP